MKLHKMNKTKRYIKQNKLNVIGLWYQINSGIIKYLDNRNNFIDLN